MCVETIRKITDKPVPVLSAQANVQGAIFIEAAPLGLSADANHRSNWEFWGLPGNDEYDPDQADYQQWQARFGKTWWLPKFRRVRVFFEHLDGSNLDRFSGYDFGMFGDASVSGYPSGLVRAEKAKGAHILAGINYFE